MNVRGRKIVLKFPQQRRIALAKADGADSTRCCRDQHLAQLGAQHGVTDCNSCALLPEGGWRHAELRRNTFISAAAGAIARFIDSVSHALFTLERLAELSRAARLLILARADAQRAFEQPLEMKWTDLHVARDRRQAQRDIEVFVDVAAGRLNFLRLRIALQRGAAPAGPISRALRLHRRVKEFHVLKPRPAAGA